MERCAPFPLLAMATRLSLSLSLSPALPLLPHTIPKHHSSHHTYRAARAAAAGRSGASSRPTSSAIQIFAAQTLNRRKWRPLRRCGGPWRWCAQPRQPTARTPSTRRRGASGGAQRGTEGRGRRLDVEVEPAAGLPALLRGSASRGWVQASWHWLTAVNDLLLSAQALRLWSITLSRLTARPHPLALSLQSSDKPSFFLL